MASLRRALVVVQPLVVTLAFVLLALLIRREWDSLVAYQWRVRPFWLIVSVAFLVSGWLFEILMWHRLIVWFGGRIPYWSVVRIWLASGIVKYLPGKIWQPLSLTLRCQERGVRPEVTFAALSLFQITLVLAVGPITALYLVTWGRSGALQHLLGPYSVWWAIAAAAPLMLFLIRPGAVIAVANAVLTRVGRKPLPLDLSSRQVIGVLGISFLAWIGFCGGFSALALAVLPDGGPSWQTVVPHTVAAYPIAFAAGFVSVLTPSGLLVREGLLFLLLAPIVGHDSALVVALAMRVWELVLDALACAVAIGWPGIRRLIS
jgi:uncharacterized membrane protein YbhN (UPF0104 family)